MLLLIACHSRCYRSSHAPRKDGPRNYRTTLPLPVESNASREQIGPLVILTYIILSIRIKAERADDGKTGKDPFGRFR